MSEPTGVPELVCTGCHATLTIDETDDPPSVSCRCESKLIEFVIARALRDDGPLPDCWEVRS